MYPLAALTNRRLVAATVGGDAGGGGRQGEVLLVDDERDLRELLAFLVHQAGMVPLTSGDSAEAIEVLEKHRPNVVVVDLNLPQQDGFELIGEIRRRRPKVPILVLTGRASEDDKIRALDAGADDYVVKPFSHRELVARIRAQSRRAAEVGPDEVAPAFLEVGELRLDLREHVLRIDARDLRLTSTEFRVMRYLMHHSRAIVPTAILAKDVWGYDDGAARDVVRVTLHRLRRKLGDEGPGPRLIDTVPGIGVRLRPRGEEVPEESPQTA